MERLEFEPFGERLAPETGVPLTPHASRLLLRAGIGLFWSLVGVIVVARAIYFDPGTFDRFGRVVALARDLSGVF